MLRQILYVQWRWNRDVLAFFVVAAFALPLMFLRLTMPDMDLMMAGRIVGTATLVFALLAGGIIAANGYAMDERGGHVYALSLPVTRARLLGLRTITAFALLCLPAVAVWIGGLIAVSQIDIPAMLQSYAGSLAIRALLAAWLAHATVFALRYAAGRRAKQVFGALAAAAMILGVINAFFPSTRVLLSNLAEFLTTHPGPFAIVFGRWTLIDV